MSDCDDDSETLCRIADALELIALQMSNGNDIEYGNDIKSRYFGAGDDLRHAKGTLVDSIVNQYKNKG